MAYISKNLMLVLILLFMASATAQISAQNLPKKYATLELFTNTPCPSCVAQNPGFFDLLGNYENDVHQISFYPGTPYSTCPIYQANTVENRFRAIYRNYSFTPEVNVNGEYDKRSGSISASDLDAATGSESFLYVKVSESGTTNRSVDVQLQTINTSPTSTGKLFVAIVEKEVTLTGINPNWEANHHNVFREFLTDKEGMTVDLTMASQSFPFNFTVDAAWDSNEIYVMAWVENPETAETYNSGTRFDEVFSSVTSIESSMELAVYPNPAKDFISVEIPSSFNFERIEIIDAAGKTVGSTFNPQSINVSTLGAGAYTIVVFDATNNQLTSRFIKK